MIFGQSIGMAKIFAAGFLAFFLAVCIVLPANAEPGLKEIVRMAKQGDAEAQYRLALKYANAEGVSRGDKEAVYWYTQAAEQGRTDAQYNLAVMYFKGQGTSQDYVYSYAWFKMAALQGDQDAIGNSDQVASLLTPEQLAQAQDLIAEFQEKIASQSQLSNQQALEKEKEAKTEEIAGQGGADAKPQAAAAGDNAAVWATPFQFAVWNPVQLFPDTWNVYGLRASLVYGKNQDVYGLDFAFLTDRANNLRGIQFAGFQNRASETVRGIQMAGIANNGFGTDVIGIQAGFDNAAKDLVGIQFGCCSEATDSSIGIQFGAIYTKAGNLKGIQAGFINIIEKGSGLQIGIGNRARKMSGLQIGLINIIRDGFLPVFPIINFSMSNRDEPVPAPEEESAPPPVEANPPAPQ